MQERSEANKRWNDQLEEFRHSNSYKEFFRIDGEPIEFKWNIFPGRTSLEKIQKDLQSQNGEPQHCEERIIFMSMFNDIDWTKRRNSEKCLSNSEQVKNYAKRFSRGHWTFLGPGDEKKFYGTLSYTSEGKWDSIATEMVGHFKETGHPVFKSISALRRGIPTRKGGRDTIHLNADSSNTELLIRTIHSAAQVSIYGAVSSWCEEFAQRTPNQKEPTAERFAAKENEQPLKNMKPQDVTCANSKVR